jgi:hypothetical protein
MPCAAQRITRALITSLYGAVYFLARETKWPLSSSVRTISNGLFLGMISSLPPEDIIPALEQKINK